MQFNVAQLLKQGVGAKRDYEIDEEFTPEEEGLTRVSGPVRLLRTRRGVLVTAQLKGEARGTCSRCLRPAIYPVELKIEEEFVQTVDVTTGAPLDLPEDSTEFTIDERHILDLGEATRQYGTLALSMKPLCRPDCPGLCPQCGRELGPEHQGCEQDGLDARLSNLRQLQNA